jgi:hypothetical protein
MILHVLPGDAIVDTFTEANIDGEIAVCREALVDGDLRGDTLPQFWENRARFHAQADPHAADDYHEKIVREFAKLTALQSGSEINLWFEYELFCNANMWFCLSLLTGTTAKVFRVMPVTLTEANIWEGFGQLQPEVLRECFANRVELSSGDVQLGADLWDAYRTNDHESLKLLSATDSPAFPVLRDVCIAATEKDFRPAAVLDEIVEEGVSDFENVFKKFSARAGVYGYGDSQVKKLWQEIR